MSRVASTQATRDKILDAADSLFGPRGVRIVGVDAIVEASGVAKMTLYKHFESKEALVAAWLARRSERWLAGFDACLARAAALGPPSIDTLFDALAEWFADPQFRGCPFVNVLSEISDPGHSAREVCKTHRDNLRRRIVALANSAGFGNAAALADHLILLADGAIVAALAGTVQDPAGLAKQSAAALTAGWPRLASVN